MNMTTELKIQNGTVYHSDDVEEIFRAVYTAYNALPETYEFLTFDYVGGQKVEVLKKLKRRKHDLPEVPIRVRYYNPKDAEVVADCFHDTEGNIIVLKIRRPNKLQQSSLVALAQCADEGDPSVSRRALVRLVATICTTRGLNDMAKSAESVVAAFALKLRYGAKVSERVVRQQKREDLLLRLKKQQSTLQNCEWNASVLRNKVEKAEAKCDDVRRMIAVLQRKLGEL